MRTSAKRLTVTLAGVAATGALISLAGRFGARTPHDYWISVALTATAGLVFGLTLRLQQATGTSQPAAVAAALVALWIAIGIQPNGGHVSQWSHDLGIAGRVRQLGAHVGVLSFAACALLAAAATLQRRRRRPEPPPEIEPDGEPIPESADLKLTAIR